MCNDGYFGAVCGSDRCLGTTYRTAASGVIRGAPVASTELPNDVDCRWVISPAGAVAGSDVVELVFTEFDLDNVRGVYGVVVG